MQLKIHRPRLLAAMLLLIGIMSTSVMLLADGGDEVIKTRFIPFPTVATEALPLTEEQKQDAVSIARESGIVESINGGQEWTTSLVGNTQVEGYEAVGLIVEWHEPVDSSGPWAVVRCGGALKQISLRPFSNITQLHLIVDMEEREILNYSVTGEPGKEAVMGPRDPDSSVQFYEIKTGKLVFEQAGKSIASVNQATWDKLCHPSLRNR